MSQPHLSINNNMSDEELTSVASQNDYSPTIKNSKKKKLGILSSFRKKKKSKHKIEKDILNRGDQSVETKSMNSEILTVEAAIEDIEQYEDSFKIEAEGLNGEISNEMKVGHSETITITRTTKDEIVESDSSTLVKMTQESVSHKTEEGQANNYQENEKWTARKVVTEQHLLNHASGSSEASRPSSPSKSKRRRMPTPKPTHMLKVRLLSGENLAPRDSNGYSDPYVKFKYAGRTVHKSKTIKATLDPKWSESFKFPVNPAEHLLVRVYDRDLVSADDFMGSAKLDLDRLPDCEEKEIRLSLEDDNNDEEELGSIHVAVIMEALSPGSDAASDKLSQFEEDMDMPDGVPTIADRVSKFERSDSTASKLTTVSTDSRNRYANRSMPVATVTIQLVSASGLPACDSNGLSDPYCRLSLGKQKVKSKVCPKTLNPVWQEEYTFTLTSRDSVERDGAMLDIAVYDKDNYRRDDFIGRCEIDLWKLDFDKTHSCEQELIDAPGKVLLLVTVHSIQRSEQAINMTDLKDLQAKYSAFSSFKDLSDVGFLEVKVIKASGLRAADIGGKSDPFCVIELCNARAQTHTCYKTLDPEWHRTYTFPIKDIHEVINITVYDEDKDKNREFLGKIAIPLLNVTNGQQRVYALKDRKLQDRSKGSVTIEINVFYNPVRASIRTFTPREEQYMLVPPKFKPTLLKRNFQRTWRCIQAVMATAEFVNSCFTWKHPIRSALAFLAYILIVWNFELYLIPIALLLLLFKNYFDIYMSENKKATVTQQDSLSEEDDDETEENRSLSFMQKINTIQEILGKVQNTLDWIASLLERIGGTFTWRVPFLSWLAVFVLSVVTVVLYFIPVRTIALLWGINKFTKRLRKPNYIPNNELLDFLSRLPSNVQVLQYQTLAITPESPKNTKKKKQ